MKQKNSLKKETDMDNCDKKEIECYRELNKLITKKFE